MKKLFMLMGLLTVLSFTSNVMALDTDEVYYTNDNGVSLTEEEYNFISMYYFEGFQDIMDQDEYDYMIDNNLMDGEITITEVTDAETSLARDVTHTTASKKLKLSCTCSASPCSVTLTLTWLTSPNVRSYDLIGAYSPTKGSLVFNSSILYHSDGSSVRTEYNQESYGISATMKLPTDKEDIVIIMHFTANKNSTVYASYQHAKKTITLANSRKYSFNSGGYGGVFLFESGVKDYYDAMGGIKTTI